MHATHSAKPFQLNKSMGRSPRGHGGSSGAVCGFGAIFVGAGAGFVLTTGGLLAPSVSATVGTSVEAIACANESCGEIIQPHVFLPKYTVEPPIQNGYLHAAPVCGSAVAILSCSTFPFENVISKQLLGDAAQ